MQGQMQPHRCPQLAYTHSHTHMHTHAHAHTHTHTHMHTHTHAPVQQSDWVQDWEAQIVLVVLRVKPEGQL